MPWKHDNKVIRAGRGWVSDKGIKHPTNWMSWSDEEKKAAGLVWEDDPKPFDSRFWWDATTPRDIHNQKNDDGSVTPGLKTLWKQKTKETAASLLAPTDWQVIKANEVSDYTVPSAITQYRSDVRAASNTIETAIDAASDMTAFMALWDAPVDGNAPINDWPDKI